MPLPHHLHRPRQVEHSLVAHQAGIAAMDVRGDLVATCGMTLRGGRLVPDTSVRVYDVRGALRPLFSPPFSAGPALLAWHPNFSTTLLVGAASGLFCLMDVGTSFAQTYQVGGRAGGRPAVLHRLGRPGRPWAGDGAARAHGQRQGRAEPCRAARRLTRPAAARRLTPPGTA
jgi:hypothetical protein